jgi:uncharacterized protein (UPF0261 family)
MTKVIVIIGALDTKGREFAFVRDLIKAAGLRPFVVDFGVLGTPLFEPDITRRAVAEAAGASLEQFQSGEHKDDAMASMSKGLVNVVRSLYAKGQLDGILGMGGTGGTSIATAAMRELPIGVPKVMVSTVAGGDVSSYSGTRDIVFIPSVVDVAGLNRISRRIYSNAAAAIVGMVKAAAPDRNQGDKPLVVASMFGNTTSCVDRARTLVEEHGFEVLVFHATGIGGRTMESLIADGFVTASMDITTTELADEVCGGVFSAGPERGLAASRAGIPAVLVPGCVDMANFGPPETVPERYRGRLMYRWNPNVTLLRTNAEENRAIGALLAAAANASTAPVAFVLPLRGVSMLDAEGHEFWDPVADSACFDAIESAIRPGIPVSKLDLNINDPAFADEIVRQLLDILPGAPIRSRSGTSLET